MVIKKHPNSASAVCGGISSVRNPKPKRELQRQGIYLAEVDCEVSNVSWEKVEDPWPSSMAVKLCRR